MAELPNRVWSIFESTRPVEIADPVVLDEGCVNLRSGAVIRRFDAHLCVALRENADDPKLFADVWWPWPFQLLVALPCHELDGPRAAVTEESPRLPNECHWLLPAVFEGPRPVANEEFPRLPNECHWLSPTEVEGPRPVANEEFPRLANECHWLLPGVFGDPRAAVTEEFPRFPNECHWLSLVVEGPRVIVKEGFPRLPNECHWLLPLAEPKAPKVLDEGGPAG